MEKGNEGLRARGRCGAAHHGFVRLGQETHGGFIRTLRKVENILLFITDL